MNISKDAWTLIGTGSFTLQANGGCAVLLRSAAALPSADDLFGDNDFILDRGDTVTLNAGTDNLYARARGSSSPVTVAALSA
jgi:hypothetical protein